MSKKTGLHVWFALLAIALVLSSCGLAISTRTPTPVPPYIHYTPSKESNIHLEFDYLSSWTFSEYTENVDFLVIGLGDPLFLTLPTRAPYESHGTPNDFGGIDIWIVPSKPGQSPDTELESLKQGYKEEPHITLLKDYKITVDGYDASVLEYQLDAIEPYTSLMFARRIFVVVKHQMDEILFTIAEKDRGGEFEKGYEYFFKSLKIVP